MNENFRMAVSDSDNNTSLFPGQHRTVTQKTRRRNAKAVKRKITNLPKLKTNERPLVNRTRRKRRRKRTTRKNEMKEDVMAIFPQ